MVKRPDDHHIVIRGHNYSVDINCHFDSESRPSRSTGHLFTPGIESIEDPTLTKEAAPAGDATARVVLPRGRRRYFDDPIAEAEIIHELQTREGLRIPQLAERRNLAESTVILLLSMLRLPASVQALVRRGELYPTTAQALLCLPDVASQEKFAAVAIKERLSAKRLKDRISRARRKG
jgi:hypothetical protein